MEKRIDIIGLFRDSISLLLSNLLPIGGLSFIYVLLSQIVTIELGLGGVFVKIGINILNLCIMIALTRIVALAIVGRESFKNESSFDLIKKKFFNVIGIGILAGLLISVSAIPMFIALVMSKGLTMRIVFVLITIIPVFVVSCYLSLTLPICILRDVDSNHWFSQGSISESFSLVKRAFISIIIIQLILGLVDIPSLLQIFSVYASSKLVFLTTGAFKVIDFIKDVIMHPITIIINIKLMYILSGIDKEYLKDTNIEI